MTDPNRTLLAEAIERRNNLRDQKTVLENRLVEEQDVLRRLRFAYEGVKDIEEQITRWRIENIRSGGAPDTPVPKNLEKLRSQKDDYVATIAASEKMIEATQGDIQALATRIEVLEKGDLTDSVWNVVSDHANELAKQLAATLDEYNRLSLQIWAIDTSKSGNPTHYFRGETARTYRPAKPPAMPWQVYFNNGQLARYGEQYREQIRAFQRELAETSAAKAPQ